MDIDTFLSSVQPFDLIVFRNTGLVGKIISFVEWVSCGAGEISHVGCIINRDVCPLITMPGNFILESNIDLGRGAAPDARTGEGTLGVQIRNLETVVRSVIEGGGEIGWCKVKNNPWVLAGDDEAAKDKIRWEVSRFYFTYAHALYDLNPFSLLGGAFPFMRKARDKIVKRMRFLNMHKWMFCSELVAMLYIKVGILNIDPDNAQNVIPVDFISGVDLDGMVSPVENAIWIKLK